MKELTIASEWQRFLQVGMVTTHETLPPHIQELARACFYSGAISTLALSAEIAHSAMPEGQQEKKIQELYDEAHTFMVEMTKRVISNMEAQRGQPH